MIALGDFRLVIDLFDNIALIDEKLELVFQGNSLKNQLSAINIDLGSLSESGSDILLKEINEKIISAKELSVSRIFTPPVSQAEFLIVPYLNDHIIFGLKQKVVTILQIEHDLNERVKELTCLYDISKESDLQQEPEQFLENCIELIETAFQYPSDTIVNIYVRGKKYGRDHPENNGFYEAAQCRIPIGNEHGNTIKIYLKNNIRILPEEINLIEEISRKITRIIEKQEKTANIEKQREILSRKNEVLLKLTEECFQKRENLRTFFRAIADKIVVIDKEYNIITSNKDEIGEGGKCFSKLFGLQEPCENCPAVRTFRTGEDSFIHQKFGERYYSLSSHPIAGFNINAGQVLEVCRDITDRKRMEDQLFQSYKLASLGKLVAGVAHEINNPNTFILGNMKIVKEGLEDIFPYLDKIYEQNKDLKIARLNYNMFRENIFLLVNDMINGAERTKKIVADLRNFAKKDEGGLTDIVDLNDIIRNHLTLTQKHVKKHANMVLDLKDDLPVFRGSMNKLEQVFLNLIMNASEAIEGNEGLIIIKTDYNLNDKKIILEISDNGCGMDESVAKNIFDPFFTTKRNKGGIGLGLSITYGIIKDHNGFIDVRSKPGEGTAFIIKFPMIDK